MQLFLKKKKLLLRRFQYEINKPEPLTITCPELFIISPNIAEQSDDFPDPTVPTIANKLPFFFQTFKKKK